MSLGENWAHARAMGLHNLMPAFSSLRACLNTSFPANARHRPLCVYDQAELRCAIV
jgi:hypothetical protein